MCLDELKISGVYLTHPGYLPKGCYKFGCAKNIYKRFKSYSGNRPITVKECKKYKIVESKLKKAFTEYIYNGNEWIQGDIRVLTAIFDKVVKNACAGYEDNTNYDIISKLENEDMFPVEKVVEHIGEISDIESVMFEIKWQGYSSSENTIEPYEKVYMSSVVQNYIKRIKKHESRDDDQTP